MGFLYLVLEAGRMKNKQDVAGQSVARGHNEKIRDYVDCLSFVTGSTMVR